MIVSKWNNQDSNKQGLDSRHVDDGKTKAECLPSNGRLTFLISARLNFEGFDMQGLVQTSPSNHPHT